jgi:Family of unknown function (DUF5759)
MQAKEIVQREKKRNDVKKETYKAMLDQFSRKIKTSSDLGNKYCILTVPPFLVGFPRYDIARAVMYMCRQLQRLGYTVNLIGPFDIKVEWHKTPEPTVEEEIETPDLFFPSLVNLHKAAGKIRVQKKGK